MNSIHIESARMLAEAAQARADVLADAWEAARQALDPLRSAAPLTSEAAVMLAALEANWDALRTRYRTAQAEADRLAGVASRLDRLTDPVGDGLTPEEWDEHERGQDRLQREHDQAMDAHYA